MLPCEFKLMLILCRIGIKPAVATLKCNTKAIKRRVGRILTKTVTSLTKTVKMCCQTYFCHSSYIFTKETPHLALILSVQLEIVTITITPSLFSPFPLTIAF